MSSTTITPVNAQAVAKKGSVEASRSGIWVGIFAITMSFAAFTSALFVRQGSASDWQHIVLPPVLYLNTLALLVSSVTFEMSRRSISAGPVIESDAARKGLGWLFLTLVLGVAFFAGQYVAWQRLQAQGIFLATNPNSSFFYVLTAMHGIHLLGGIAALIYVIGRLTARHSTFRRSLFDNTAIYWHIMGILWVYLLLICRTKL
jgi:cytochrome c oxidase subunit 3